MSTPIYDAMIREQRWRELTRTTRSTRPNPLIPTRWPLHKRDRPLKGVKL